MKTQDFPNGVRYRELRKHHYYRDGRWCYYILNAIRSGSGDVGVEYAAAHGLHGAWGGALSGSGAPDTVAMGAGGRGYPVEEHNAPSADMVGYVYNEWQHSIMCSDLRTGYFYLYERIDASGTTTTEVEYMDRVNPIGGGAIEIFFRYWEPLVGRWTVCSIPLIENDTDKWTTGPAHIYEYATPPEHNIPWPPAVLLPPLPKSTASQSQTATIVKPDPQQLDFLINTRPPGKPHKHPKLPCCEWCGEVVFKDYLPGRGFAVVCPNHGEGAPHSILVKE